ncbi:transcriptional regulator [Paractinoplanes abujensis]|uniref:AraC-like DNA-binding protein n=1 Tax=Paractinoplanes abujensis TaxID=882441 RepID=A0A7W7D0Y1_9ACTN|nr:helix-turn-helix transcriptional regulator [Actinoplanes abujensis]MBB4697939.1 AraC-like DNA-binding protein [Actinoplanes abujensis]GID19579.1 transcriptional regulator [Actinoplanes abujensis]
MSSAVTRQETATTFRPPGWAGVGTCALDATSAQPPVRLPYHVLVLATAGHGTVEVDFFGHACRPGTLLWIRPGQALRVGRNGLIASVVTFEPRFAEQGDEVPLQNRWQLRGEDEDAVISEFTQLAVDSERHAPSSVAADLLRHQLRVLLLRLALLSSGSPAGPESRTYTRFRGLLEAGHSHSRRVEDYAEELGCSVRTLTRACLSVTGRTAKQVVDDRVSLEARRLLACTPLSVAEVGRHLGFPEPTNFGRFFHREVGMSPGQFRAEASGEPRGIIPAQRRSSD